MTFAVIAVLVVVTGSLQTAFLLFGENGFGGFMAIVMIITAIGISGNLRWK